MNRFLELALRYLEKNIGLKITRYNPLRPGEKIRAVFIFQVASFWPSLEPLYRIMITDNRFDVTIVCYDEDVDRTIKTETARKYLLDNRLQFTDWKDFDFNNNPPHIVFLQTPYDTNRKGEFTSSSLIKNGCRVIYVPYGIETGDTKHSRKAQFEGSVIRNAWKIYVNSDKMKADYCRNIPVKTEIVTTGLPRLDSLYNKDSFKIDEDILRKANGRKMILWKVHFPKDIEIDHNHKVRVTPELCEYVKFAEMIRSLDDLFFIFMPHPRFLEYNEDPGTKEQLTELMDKVKKSDNVFIDNSDDYRPTLVNCDALIVDRSTIMVEAGTLNVPILFMHNADYNEPMNDSIAPLIDSYCQGTTCKDMVSFVADVRNNLDVNSEKRTSALKECLPLFDGKCSERVIDDIISSIDISLH